jgi:hypothetical protein
LEERRLPAGGTSEVITGIGASGLACVPEEPAVEPAVVELEGRDRVGLRARAGSLELAAAPAGKAHASSRTSRTKPWRIEKGYVSGAARETVFAGDRRRCV